MTQKTSSLMARLPSVDRLLKAEACAPLIDAFGRTDCRADMAAFKVPTLVIHGTSDATVPFEISGKRAAAAIAGAKLEAYDGAPHGLHYTEQDRLVRDLADFAR